MEETKVCSRCGEVRNVSEYRTQIRNNKIYYHKVCRLCIALYNKERLATNGDTIRAASKRYRDRHKEEIKIKAAEWRSNNKEHVKEYNLEYQKSNPDLVSASCRNWRVNNIDVVHAGQKAYRDANKEKTSARNREWSNSNPQKNRERYHRRRALKLGAVGSFSSDSIDRMYIFQEARCACCGVELCGKYAIDHVYPLSKGGTNDVMNLQLLCKSCNCIKGAKDPEAFIKYLKIHYPERYQYYYKEQHGLMVGYYKGDL